MEIGLAMIRHRNPSGPVLNPLTLLTRPNCTLPPPLDSPTASFHPYGRVALLEGLRILRIKPGDNVLVPSFICASAIAPFNKLDIDVRYYEVDDQLQPRYDTAARILDSRTKAFLGVHYFGFPQDVEAIGDFCEEYGLYYIEDNSHGLLSALGSRPLGTFGDISVFSQRKTLALPHGGALVVNRPSLLPHDRILSTCPPMRGEPSAFRFLLRGLALNLDIFPYLDIEAFLRRFARDQDQENSLEHCFEADSRLANWILVRADFGREKRVRRLGFMFWRNVFGNARTEELSPVFDDLPHGVVPLWFPIRVRRRRNFIDELDRKGIRCLPWPPRPPRAPITPLNSEIAVIPLHPTTLHFTHALYNDPSRILEPSENS